LKIIFFHNYEKTSKTYIIKKNDFYICINIELINIIIMNPTNFCGECKNATDAAKNGHLECLVYAHTNGCPWDELTCAKAAENGHLECLVYAHENGCPWDKWTCTYAADNGHLECLMYAEENGCQDN
jgi:hypothetical protein